MPTYTQMHIFTWKEISYFKWSEVSADTLHFAEISKEKELLLPNSVKEKVLQLCKDEFAEYARILGKPIQPPASKLSTIADILGIISFLETLLNNSAVSEIVSKLYNLLLALLAGQL